jgi:hypothetical protein
VICQVIRLVSWGLWVLGDASSSVWLVGFVFQRLILLSVPQAREHYDQCDQLEEERGRAPNLSDEPESFSAQVRHRAHAARSKVVSLFVWLGDIAPFCVPLELD